MNMRLMFALVFLLLLDLPVSAERTCMECLQAAQKELIHCLHNAIREEERWLVTSANMSRPRPARTASAWRKEKNARNELHLPSQKQIRD